LFADGGQVVEEPTFTLSEAEQLFEAYDDENVNFVTIGRIRERCRNNYKLPDAILYNFLLPIEKIADDEMFNRIEFFRMLKPYITVGVCLCWWWPWRHFLIPRHFFSLSPGGQGLRQVDVALSNTIDGEGRCTIGVAYIKTKLWY